MRNSTLILFSLVFFATLTSVASELDYSSDQKRAIYSAHRGNNDSAKPFLTHKDRAWHELNIPALLVKINRTKTSAGFVELESLLAPTSNMSELNKRRTFIEFLINNPKTANQLSEDVALFAREHESLFIHFLDPDAGVQFLQDKELASFGQTSSLAQLGMQGFMTLLIGQNIVYEGRQAYRNWGDVRGGQIGGFQRGWIGYNLIGQGLGVGWASYYAFRSASATFTRIFAADDYVLKTGQGLDLISHLDRHIQDIPVLKQSIFAEAFKSVKGGAFETARARTSNKSFLGPLSILGSLDTYDALRNSKKGFARILQGLATLDAYLSVAALYRECQDNGYNMTLATFETSDKLGFDFKGLTNPIIDKSIPNDMSLGLSEPSQHAVLTGPHACGKTTIMKSAAFAFVMGQSILIVPAKQARFVPLTDMKTYFNIGDNIVEGLSSFMAEHERMAELKDIAMHLTGNARVLMLIDEPYAKTIQTIGEPRVTSFLQSLSSVPNLSIILATHFEAPSHLDWTTKGRVKNFQPEVDVSLRPTYKIIEGAADWWFHDIERRELFIEQLIHKKRNL